jgi:carbamoyltransferase
MRIVGTKFYGHESALCLLDTREKTVFAMSTERVTRIKHDSIGISPILQAYDFKDIDCVTHSMADFENKGKDNELRGKMTCNKDLELLIRSFYNPLYIKDLNITKKTRKKIILKSIVSNFPGVVKYYLIRLKRALIIENALKNKVTLTKYIRKTFNKFNLFPKEIEFIDHHLCHSSAAYFLSPYNSEKALSLTIDGKGDGFFSKLYLFNGNSHELIGESYASFFGGGDHCYLSIGHIYQNFTEAMDLRANNDEGKVEALAAFGIADQDLLNQLKDATIIDSDSLSINFDINKIKPFYDINFLKVKRLNLGDENFCSVVQSYLEDTIVDYLSFAYEKYPIKNLCLSGGVAANIIMSLNIYEKTHFKNIYVLPPMGDEGTALGGAILKATQLNKDVSWLKDYVMPYFGDEYSREQVKSALDTFDSIIVEDQNSKWPEEAAKSVAEGKICSLFHGRMEFGPRALGNRSIIGSPMIEDTRQRINSTVKRRPSYQPFCPSILEEERERLFKNSFSHKHMAIAFRMREEFISDLPCAVHVDGTARPQFVEEQDNPSYYRYLKALKKITGYGVSLNTSFNLHGRTIVRTPEDAVVDFIDCNLDELFIEGYKVTRK